MGTFQTISSLKHWYQMKIKAVFSEENDVPKSQIESTALHCVKIIQAEIHQLFPMRACTNTILVEL